MHSLLEELRPLQTSGYKNAWKWKEFEGNDMKITHQRSQNTNTDPNC